jgi:hypothetical protein
MPRTRRLFALNGIETVPVIAPMPTTLTTGDQVNKIMIIVVVQTMKCLLRFVICCLAQVIVERYHNVQYSIFKSDNLKTIDLPIPNRNNASSFRTT